MAALSSKQDKTKQQSFICPVALNQLTKALTTHKNTTVALYQIVVYMYLYLKEGKEFVGVFLFQNIQGFSSSESKLSKKGRIYYTAVLPKAREC